MASYLYGGRRLVVDGSLASASWEQSGIDELESVCVVGERVELFDKAPDGAERWSGADFALLSPSNPAGGVEQDTQPMAGFSEDVWF